MTVLELLEDFRRLTGNKPELDAYAFQYLNRAQEHVSRELRIPRRQDLITSASPLTLPASSWGDGLLQVFDVEQRRLLPIYTLGEANIARPGWQDVTINAGKPEYAVYTYDYSTATFQIHLVPGHTQARQYRVYYVIKPTDLTPPTTLPSTTMPFNNLAGYEALHPLIPLWAAWLAGNQLARQDYENEVVRLRPRFAETAMPSNPYLEALLGITPIDMR